MAEFTIGDFTYVSTVMPAMTQFHIVKRLAPALAAFTEYNEEMKALPPSAESSIEDEGAAHRRATSKVIETAGKAIGSLSDEASDYILSSCLSLCRRRRVDSPAATLSPPLWNLQAKGPQFTDINMGIMLQIAMNVLKDALGDFFPESLSSFKAA